MSLLKAILESQGGGGGLDQLASKFGLDRDKAESALGELIPAVNHAVKKNASQPGGLDAILGALKNGNHARFLEDENQLHQDSTADEGNRILGHVFGSKDVSRKVAAHASEKTGIDSGILKKLLPFAASMAMGALSKKTKDSGLQDAEKPGASQLSGLTGFLDQDGDGSYVDDIFGFFKKLF